MARDYKVGYRKPPATNRFKPGRSGNPKGRPKKSLNLTTTLTAELSETITVRENGKSRRINKQEALLKALVAKGLRGDVKAMNAVLALVARLLSEQAPAEEVTIDKDELMILNRFGPRVAQELARRRKKTNARD